MGLRMNKGINLDEYITLDQQNRIIEFSDEIPRVRKNS